MIVSMLSALLPVPLRLGRIDPDGKLAMLFARDDAPDDSHE
jgi:hypothetical protein